MAPMKDLELAKQARLEDQMKYAEYQDASFEKILDNIVASASRRAADDLLSGKGSHDSIIFLLERLTPEVIK